MITVEERLDRIHADLDSVRSLLQRPAQSDPSEMLGHLRSAVEQLSFWAQGVAIEGDAPERRDIEEIQESLRQMQPLFDNARSLQAGLVELISDEDWVPYGSDGTAVGLAMAAGEAQQG